MISNGIRYFEMKYPINYEVVIKIYQSCRKNLLLFLCCMLFAVGGVYMIIDEDESCRFVIKFIVCWLSVIFFEELDRSWVSPLFIKPKNAYHI